MSPEGTSDEGERDLDGDGDPGPRIVKTKRFAAKPMDPEEAALQMERRRRRIRGAARVPACSR